MLASLVDCAVLRLLLMAKPKCLRPKVVYHYIQWKNIIPDFVVDITGFMEAKVNAVLAYSSQFYDSSSNEPTTPISDRNFLDSVTYRARRPWKAYWYGFCGRFYL